MEKDVLSQVIEAEKEIQKCIENEKLKAREWVDGVTKECDESFLREEKKIREYLQKELDHAAGQAEAEAAGIVSQAEGAAQRLKTVKKEILSAIIQRHIARILPG